MRERQLMVKEVVIDWKCVLEVNICLPDIRITKVILYFIFMVH